MLETGEYDNHRWLSAPSWAWLKEASRLSVYLQAIPPVRATLSSDRRHGRMGRMAGPRCTPRLAGGGRRGARGEDSRGNSPDRTRNSASRREVWIPRRLPERSSRLTAVGGPHCTRGGVSYQGMQMSGNGREENIDGGSWERVLCLLVSSTDTVEIGYNLRLARLSPEGEMQEESSGVVCMDGPSRGDWRGLRSL